jgi:phospholipid/cholesterol/gamma-HCH transport system substrate-binding protein
MATHATLRRDTNLETKVGLFVLIGLALIGTLMILFGRVGEKWSKTYNLTVDFPNANGLIKGASVNLAGAPVGRVLTSPKPLENGSGVEVKLRLSSEARIRSDARFSIAEVGLMGDRNVSIEPIFNSDKPYIEEGSVIKGNESSDLTNLASAAQPILAQIQQITDKFNNDVMTPETTADLRVSIKELRSVLTRADSLLAEAQTGKGPLGVLLKDPKTANDLTAFISNLRKKGILFYSDVAGKDDDGQRKTNR